MCLLGAYNGAAILENDLVLLAKFNTCPLVQKFYSWVMFKAMVQGPVGDIYRMVHHTIVWAGGRVMKAT